MSRVGHFAAPFGAIFSPLLIGNDFRLLSSALGPHGSTGFPVYAL